MLKVTPELLEKFEFKVPRYTSYPTAPHFSADVGGDTYASWLSMHQPSVPISLYIHVPYCDTLCWFCACNTQITSNYGRVESYMKWLEAEAELLYQHLGFRPKVARIHWGGGSPTMLKADDWKKMNHIIHRYFDVLSDASISVELDPRDIKRDYTQNLFDMGINRASIGVQDFDPVVQKAINRVQPFEVVEEVVLGLRDVGIDDINLDIMYGLPHQTLERTISMSEKCLKLKPKRVALFGYAHVPWMKPHQQRIDEKDLAGGFERYQLFKAIEEVLMDGDLEPLGLDHFALCDDSLYQAQKAGRMRRNFQGYTTDTATALIGLGPSSVGSLEQGYTQNQTSISLWKSEIKQGMLPIQRGLLLSREDRLRSRIIEKLMCDLWVDVDEEIKKWGGSEFIFDAEFKNLQPLVDEGIIEIDGYRITIHMENRLFLRLVASVFDAYLKKNQTRYSRAI